jgi:hypothetical protein
MRQLGARAIGLVLLCAGAAGAQTTVTESTLRFQVTNCGDDLAGRLPSVVKLEIDVLLRERGPARSPPERIAVRCEEEKARIDVTLDGASRTSTIDLHALAAEHRARAVALAAAELVHAMAGQPRPPDAPPTPVATLPMSRSEPDRPAPDASSRRSSPGATLLVGGLAEWRGTPAALLFGGRAAFQYALGNVITPELSVDASFGGISAGSARVTAESLSTGAHLYFGATTGFVRWDVGPGARFGWIHLAGEPDAGSGLQGSTLSAAWGGPEVRARVAYRASQLRPALFALEAGAGMIALPVLGLRDGTQPVYAVEGPWLSVSAQVGLGL